MGTSRNTHFRNTYNNKVANVTTIDTNNTNIKIKKG